MAGNFSTIAMLIGISTNRRSVSGRRKLSWHRSGGDVGAYWYSMIASREKMSERNPENE